MDRGGELNNHPTRRLFSSSAVNLRISVYIYTFLLYWRGLPDLNNSLPVLRRNSFDPQSQSTAPLTVPVRQLQIIFDGFSVGRFDEGLSDNDGDTIDPGYTPSGELHGCPEGFMQVRNCPSKVANCAIGPRILRLGVLSVSCTCPNFITCHAIIAHLGGLR